MQFRLRLTVDNATRVVVNVNHILTAPRGAPKLSVSLAASVPRCIQLAGARVVVDVAAVQQADGGPVQRRGPGTSASTEYVSDELLQRHGDTVWRLRLGRRHVYLLVLLEFQSEDDHWMALRTLTYSGLLYQELVRNRASVVAAERLPAVLPVVLYNGARPWTATREMRAPATRSF